MFITPGIDVEMRDGKRAVVTLISIRYRRPHLLRQDDAWRCVGSGIIGESMEASRAWAMWVAQAVDGRGAFTSDVNGCVDRIEFMIRRSDLAWRFL